MRKIEEEIKNGEYVLNNVYSFIQANKELRDNREQRTKTENREQRTENREQRTENKEQRTENR